MPFDAQKQRESKTGHSHKRQKLFCASCSHLVTYQDLAFSLKDAHEHTVFNPAGILFTIGCFLDAPGCWSTGQASAQFSWFPGYKWRLSLCEGCGKHLGWLFTGAQTPPAFYGLILNRLCERKPD